MFQQPQGLENLHVPAQISQQAMMFQLGSLRNVYKPRISNPLMVIGIALGIILADVVLFAVILLLGYIVYLLIIVPIFAVAYGIFGLLNCNLRVYDFEHGLLRSKGSQMNVIRWDQVASVWQESKVSSSGYLVGGVLGALLFSGRNRHIFKVSLHDGATFTFSNSNISQIENLGQIIQQEVAQIHMPLAIAAYDSGNIIPFGPLSVSRQGISNQKGATLPWSQVNGVTVNMNVVTIMQNERVQKWVSAPTAKVPNLGVLTALIDYARNNARQQA